MKLLIDTNVILDALMNRGTWASSAHSLLVKIAEETVEGYVTANTITDLYYLLRKYFQDKSKAKQVLMDLTESIKILDVNSKDCERAFTLDVSDFEDALIISCAVRHNIDYIVTRNLVDFKNSLVKSIETSAILLKI